MLINIVGNVNFDIAPEGLYFGSEESGIYLRSSGAKLVEPREHYLRFCSPESKVFNTYKGGGSLVVTGSDEWSTEDLFVGGNEQYIVFRILGADGNKKYEIRNWSGSALAYLPFIVGEKYFASTWVAFLEGKLARVFNLQGEEVDKLEVISFSVGLQRPIFFTEDFAVFKKSAGASYQVYDVINGRAVSSVDVDEAVFDVLQLNSGVIFIVDARGVKILQNNLEQFELTEIYRFDVPLAVRESKVHLWCDDACLYVSVNYGGNRQVLVSLNVEAGFKSSMLAWTDPWIVNAKGSFFMGYNCLPLRRRELLSDNAILLWEAGRPLSEELLDADLSSAIIVTHEKSNAKGKHGYRLCVKDISCNRAIRSVAYELGRLLGESCIGPYNESEEIKDRKFDGQFYINISASAEPNDYERVFLAAYIRHFRDFGGLSPAGSKAPLAEPVITWELVLPDAIESNEIL